MNVTLLFLFFFLTVIFVSRKLKSNCFISVDYWLIVAYAFLIFSHVVSPYKFNTEWAWIIPYVVLCLLLTIIGYKAGMSKKRNKLYKWKINISKLYIVSLIGCVVLSYDFFRLNSITFGMRVEDQTLSILGVIGGAMAHLSIIIWLIRLFEYELYGRKIGFVGYSSVLVYVAFTLLSGGRQAILLVMISSMIILIYAVKLRKESLIELSSNLKKVRPIPLPVYFFVILIGAYFTTVSVVRSQIEDIDNKMDMFENSGQITLNEEFRSFARDVPGADVLVEAMYYYSHELPRLKILMDYYDYPPTLGFSQAHYIERRFQWLWGDWVEKTWDHVEYAVEKKGKFSAHTWGTFITNYIVDFGRIGAVIACFLTGFIFGIIGSRRAYFDPNYVFLMAWICAGCVFSIQFSPLSELCWFFPLLFASFVKIE